MKRRPLFYILIAAGVFVVLAAVLYFVNPVAPLFLLASLAIQLPIILILSRVNLSAGYRDRARARREQYRADGDAAAWLAGEEREAASVGYRYWSASTRAQSALNRAEPLAALARGGEAAALLAEVDEEKLDAADRGRFEAIVGEIRGLTP